MDELQAT